MVESPKDASIQRKDLLTLWLGMGFCLLATLGIWFLGSRLDQIPFLPDEGYSWYFWKLPEKTLMGWWSAWGLYFIHQISHFALIYYAQSRHHQYRIGLHPVNIWALILNGVFVLVHFAQTHLWFDGLAQDHPPQYPQYAVILLLVWVLLMENRRRGLILGVKIPIGKQVSSFALKYHGYVFSWAILYTFWYHPMYSSMSHLSGFFYTFLIMLQGSLFFTRIHTNRWWTFLQEFSVLVHGSIVAYTQGPNVWPMFLLGFAGLVIFTQMHGLKLSRLVRWILGICYCLAIVWIYADRGFDRVEEITRIPLAEYLLVVILALMIATGLLVFNLLSGKIKWRKA